MTTRIPPSIALVVLLFLALAAAACAPDPGQADLGGPAGEPGPTATSEPRPEPTAPDPGVPAVSRYVFSAGVSVSVPEGWVVDGDPASSGLESIRLRPETGPGSAVLVDVAHRPLEESAVADPTTWMPNEGGYEVHWSRPVSPGEVGGLLFVWGARMGEAWDGLPSLMAVFYDPLRELDVRLMTEFTPEQLAAVAESGLEQAVDAQFEAFTRIADSLRFDDRPVVSLHGVVIQGSELPDKAEICSAGLYLAPESGAVPLLLRVADPGDAPALLTDLQWKGAEVTVTGRYPAQEMFCEALICECEDYMLVHTIGGP